MKTPKERAEEAWAALRLVCPNLDHCEGGSGMLAIARVVRASMRECADVARTFAEGSILREDGGVLGAIARGQREGIAAAIEQVARR